MKFINALQFCIMLASCTGNSQASYEQDDAVEASEQTDDALTDAPKKADVTEKADTDKNDDAAEKKKKADSGIPDAARRIIEAYPDFDITYSDNYLTVNGERILVDDGKDKSFVQKLDDCDVEDMFSMTYDQQATTPAYLSDAGRGRCEALFKAMYGHSAGEVSKNLVTVNWFGQNIKFTRINNANKQLEKVAQELSGKPHLAKYFKQSSSFYWRKVRGANRQSAHSYGMTIDINVANSDFWQWANPGKSETDKIKYKNRIPLEIVKVFEKHGFIWGGRWYHFDTMHFEYRPELLNN